VWAKRTQGCLILRTVRCTILYFDTALCASATYAIETRSYGPYIHSGVVAAGAKGTPQLYPRFWVRKIVENCCHCRIFFVQKWKIWGRKPQFLQNLEAKLKFWATIISSVGNSSGLSENCNFLPADFLTLDSAVHASHKLMKRWRESEQNILKCSKWIEEEFVNDNPGVDPGWVSRVSGHTPFWLGP